MSEPLLVEIIAYAPTAFYHCTHCEVAWIQAGGSNRIHTEQVEGSLPPDLIQEYQQLSDWVRNLFQRYRDQVVVKVIDAASLEGFVKSIRYRVHRYPVIVVNHEQRVPSGNYGEADNVLRRLMDGRILTD